MHDEQVALDILRGAAHLDDEARVEQEQDAEGEDGGEQAVDQPRVDGEVVFVEREARVRQVDVRRVGERVVDACRLVLADVRQPADGRHDEDGGDGRPRLRHREEACDEERPADGDVPLSAQHHGEPDGGEQQRLHRDRRVRHVHVEVVVVLLVGGHH